MFVLKRLIIITKAYEVVFQIHKAIYTKFMHQDQIKCAKEVFTRILGKTLPKISPRSVVILPKICMVKCSDFAQYFTEMYCHFYTVYKELRA